jgi:hypothetical protein
MTVDWAEFNRCRPLLEDALEHNGFGETLDQVKDGLAKGEYYLWPGRESAIVTEQFQAGGKVCVNFFLAGGDMDELAEMTPRIEAWAKKSGADQMMVYGRRGWERSFLKRAGYRPRWAILVKDLK